MLVAHLRLGETFGSTYVVTVWVVGQQGRGGDGCFIYLFDGGGEGDLAEAFERLCLILELHREAAALRIVVIRCKCRLQIWIFE